MTDTARDYKTLTTADTNGMDDLFECDAIAMQCETGDITSATQCEAVDLEQSLLEDCTIVEASQRLGVAPSTIYRRIKAGKYQTKSLMDGTVKVLLPRVVTMREAENLITATQCEAVAADILPCEAAKSANATQREAVQNASSSPEMNILSQAFDDMARKLEAATYRVGWLESQLQEREKDIKLLTDSQHKTSRWAVFKKWFLGQQDL